MGRKGCTVGALVSGLVLTLLTACSAEPAAEYVTIEPGVGLEALLEDAELVSDGGCLFFEVPPDSVLQDKRFRAAFPTQARMDGDTVRAGNATYTVGESSDVTGGLLEGSIGIDVDIPAACEEPAPIWAVSG